MVDRANTEIRAYGVRLLLSRHPEIRRLKRMSMPSVHGNRLWSSTWLLMDYLKGKELPGKARVMEVGCGWGLAGIYCAKRYSAKVTGVDVDPEVFPYLRLHAEINKVQISSLNRSFDRLGIKYLQEVDVLIGADICFWDKMVDPLKRLILRALRAGVELVLIADPGRSPFEQVCEYFVKRRRAEALDWTARQPKYIQGRLLKITANGF